MSIEIITKQEIVESNDYATWLASLKNMLDNGYFIQEMHQWNVLVDKVSEVPFGMIGNGSETRYIAIVEKV